MPQNKVYIKQTTTEKETVTAEEGEQILKEY